ncbi:MAG: bifunctional demethylmenaquinone methyltransferase/2-methoxy-6-polyprenyl-1,4-benzoquinol methylase UbiE [Deltaproteobacteria bacterium]|nr:bifunctional demethylmenaquinone methyltransferase/2-methoxy-6-polyprenyl-1,4-benzoquinol methylase UbiE [Deltaproteobacteria bacterium]
MASEHEVKELTEDRRQTASFGYRQVSAAAKGKLVHQHFDTVARKYDLMNTLLSFGLHHLWKRAAVRMMELKPGDRVLDVCGGTADLALRAARAIGDTGRVIVYDINWAMMAAGWPKVAGSTLAPRIGYIQGDAERLSCPDASFDAAMVGFGIRNLTRPEVGFKELFRVLKSGGTIMCLEFSKPKTAWFRRLYDFYSFYVMPGVGKIMVGSRDAYAYLPESIRMFSQPEELSAVLTGIGFTRVRYRRLTDGIAVIYLGVKP